MTSPHCTSSFSGSSICHTVQVIGVGDMGMVVTETPQALPLGVHHSVGRQSCAQTVMAQSRQGWDGEPRRVGQPTGSLGVREDQGSELASRP